MKINHTSIYGQGRKKYMPPQFTPEVLKQIFDRAADDDQYFIPALRRDVAGQKYLGARVREQISETKKNEEADKWIQFAIGNVLVLDGERTRDPESLQNRVSQELHKIDARMLDGHPPRLTHADIVLSWLTHDELEKLKGTITWKAGQGHGPEPAQMDYILHTFVGKMLSGKNGGTSFETLMKMDTTDEIAKTINAYLEQAITGKAVLDDCIRTHSQRVPGNGPHCDRVPAA